MKKIAVMMLAMTLLTTHDAEARRRRRRHGGPDATQPTTTTPDTTTTTPDTTTTTPPTTPTDPAATDPDAIKARELFEKGVAAYQDGRYADAIASFEESYRLRKTASVTLNLGITLRAMGRLVEARDRFREFFELASERMREQYEAEVRGYLNEIGRRVGTVHINSLNPSSASISIDDRRVVPDPNNNIDVDPGSHRIFVEAPEYLPYRAPLAVTEHATVPLDIKLDKIASGGGNPICDAAGNPPGCTPSNATPPKAGPPITSQWWFWTGIGLLAVGAGVGIAVGVSSIPLDPPGADLTIDLRNR